MRHCRLIVKSTYYYELTVHPNLFNNYFREDYMHTVEGTKAHQLACSVIIQALEDAFLLKRRKFDKRCSKIKKVVNNDAIKADAITWLKGESDAEGLKIICWMTDIEPAILVKKAREWFSGEHKDGYEFKSTEELKNALGVDLGAYKRDLRRAFSDNDDRWESSGSKCKKICNKVHEGVAK